MTTSDKVDILIENAMFEETDKNPLKARKIYE